mmetsp:Transcript_46590/g.34201  ORF Transcript_46590/g.34201 Transcript_46590/m.34201 type:complete len:106 (-) Transcript_46590:196-513(-)
MSYGCIPQLSQQPACTKDRRKHLHVRASISRFRSSCKACFRDIQLCIYNRFVACICCIRQIEFFHLGLCHNHHIQGLYTILHWGLCRFLSSVRSTLTFRSVLVHL